MAEILSRWKEGLSKTSRVAFGRLAALLGTSEITTETWEELESVLIQADLGLETTLSLLESMKSEVLLRGLTRTDELLHLIKAELREILTVPPEVIFLEKPAIVLVVGVNGSGKTTTVAKLGLRFAEMGMRPLLVGADTFRAAAIDQLQVWAERLDLPILSGQYRGDPGAVVFDAVGSAISKGYDLVLVDTAGRLHTRYNLMEELKKVYRVAGKALPGAPHAVWLVMDATTGQNALLQARAFKESVHVTGVILAKLDTSARGGMAFAISKELGLPILFAGLGEQAEDLVPFDRDAFIEGVLSGLESPA